MQYFEAIIIMLAGVGVLLIGMAMLSDNMRRIANTKLQKIFNKTSDNKLISYTIGLGTTAVVQSSSITTVMIVGLVNAGIVTLLQATVMIMGANVGTTITAHIASLAAFDFVVIAMSLACIGAFMIMLSNKEKVKIIGRVLAGLGLVFVALHLLGSSMNSFKDSEFITNSLTKMTNPFLLLFIGIILTAIFQNSSAITAIIISMAIAGITVGDGGNDVLFVILGTNIGTTVTAVLASLGANTNAKRAAFIHFLFNVIGSLLFVFVLLLWPSFKETVLEQFFKQEAVQIAMFHTLFNVACSILFVPFAQVFVSVSKKVIKDKKGLNKEVLLLDERLLKTPAIALANLKKETKVLADLSMSALRDAFNAFVNYDNFAKEDVREKVRKANKMNTEITAYLVKLSAENLNFAEEIEVSNFYHTINDIERISDLSDNITKYTDIYVKKQLNFTDMAIKDIKEMFSYVEELYKITIEMFMDPCLDKLNLANELEQKIDDMKEAIIDSHIDRLNEGICSPECSPILISLVANLERSADHMIFITQANHQTLI